MHRPFPHTPALLRLVRRPPGRSPSRPDPGPARGAPGAGRTALRGLVPPRRPRRSGHRPGLRRDQPDGEDRTPIQQASPTGAPLFAAPSTASRRAPPSSSAPARRAIRRRACAICRPATTACSRSSTSTRSSRAPTATPSGCTWISGRARTGSARPAISTAIRSRCVRSRRRRRRSGSSPTRSFRRSQPPADTDVRSNASRSRASILTKWWGHPIYIGATVLLPKGYDEHPDVNYPIVYSQGHFSTRRAGRLRPRQAIHQYWNARTARRG